MGNPCRWRRTGRRSRRLPRLTALRRAGPGRVALELDGARWRTVPDDVVARLGLGAGLELDRPLLRRLRAELREAEALARASRTLARSDVSRVRLEARLSGAGVAPESAERALERLEAAGALDDERLARRRAETLAARGWGDAAIAARLEQLQVDPESAATALAALAPEAERAAALAAAEADPHRAAAKLARRGFAPETVEKVCGALDVEP